MPTSASTGSARRTELLDAAYDYVLAHGLSDLSLRPLATAIGSSPRVLLFLFGSKEGLVGELLRRARMSEVESLARLPELEGAEPQDAARVVWGWLAEPSHRPLLNLWVEAYGRSLVESSGPWEGFARATVEDWLGLLGADASPVQRTAALAALRGCLLDLLATGDVERVGAALDLLLPRSRS